MRIYPCFVVFLVFLLLSSCAGTKFVPEGEYLLHKVDVEDVQKGTYVNISNLKSLVKQQPNTRWFSRFKIPLHVYSLSGKDSMMWFNRFLRSMGEPPVVYDSLLAVSSSAILTEELRGEGYMNAKVGFQNTVNKKKINTRYILQPGEPYYLREVKYLVLDTVIARLLNVDNPKTLGIKSGMKFNVKLLNDERQRITTILLNQGYYHFNKDYITFVADSIRGTNFIDLTLVLRKYKLRNEEEKSHPRYIINSVTYSSGDADSALHLRSSVLQNNTFVTPGEYYSYRDLQRTYQRFGRLQSVKYTNISFREHPQSNLLDCQVQLSSYKNSSISFQPEGTNTAGDLGAAASLTYQNRNVFRGSEVFSIELRGAFEAIKGLEGYHNDNFEEYSVETKLMFPRFIAPFLSKGFVKRTNATSEMSLMYDLQNRPEYHRRVLSWAWRYRWNDANHHDQYQMDLLQLNYVFMPWISDRFRIDYLEDTSNRNAILRYNYEDLFIMKWGFGFAYNNGSYAIKTNVETAGNLLQLASGVLRFSKNELGQNKLFNIAYAQYVKGDVECTKNLLIDDNTTVVLHAAVGVAYPYGNSSILPFEKRYFSGGANSVRGWSVRSLGPGKFVGRDGSIDFINQTGDIKLDFNLELRSHLFWKLDGAVFVDAGNIWTIREYEDQPGGQFRFDEFLEQLAVGYGLGIRFNFDYFILRFDMGMKAVNPAYESPREHFPIAHPVMSRDFTFHFAVGMPF